MHKVKEKNKSGGKLEIFEDFKKHLFLARPHGIINPSLLATDLDKAKEFSTKVKDHWSYVTNTEDVWLVNPFNLMFLKEIKKLPKLKQIAIFVPGFFNRILIRLASPIVQPDKIFKSKVEFNRFLENLS